LESAATIEEVSLKMRDTAGGTPALPFEETAAHSRGPFGKRSQPFCNP
jgi:hypothetical protein